MNEVRLFVVFLTALGGLIAFGVAWFAWKRREIVSAQWFAALMVVIGIWTTLRGIYYLSPSESFAELMLYLTTTAALAITPLWLVWAASYTGSDFWHSRRVLAGLAAITGTIAVFNLTGPIHGLYGSEVTIAEHSGIVLPYYESSGIVLIEWAVLVAIAALGYALLFRYYLRARAIFRRQAGIILLGSAVPILGTIVFIAGYTPHPGMDFGHILTVVYGAIMAGVLFRYDFLDVAPVAGDVLFDKIPDPVVVLDEEEKIVDYNDVGAELFADGSETRGRPLSEEIPRLATAIEADKPFTVETDAGRAVYAPRVTPIEDYRGIDRGQLLLLREITVRERRLATLEQLQDGTRLLMEGETRAEIASEVVDIVDRVLDHPYAGVFLREEGEETLTAVALTDAVEEFVEGDPPVRTDVRESEVATRAETQILEDCSCKSWIQPSNGSVGSVLVAPLGDHGMLAIGGREGRDGFTDENEYFAEILSTTARTAMERAVREAQLRENQRILRNRTEQIEFLNSILRHDLLNSIAIINGNLYRLEGHVDDEGQSYLDTIGEWTDDIEELTEEVRSIVKTMEGDDVMELRRVNLSDHLDSKVEKVRRTYENVTVNFQRDDEDIVIRANRLLGQVFENLLTNAVEHNDTDSPSVHVRTHATEDLVRVSIADDGPGIPPDQRETVFDPDVTSDPSETYGFGLYFVKTMVETYGGEIWFEESEMGGAKAVLELPRQSTLTASRGREAKGIST